MVCRSLFEKDKLIFSFLLCTRLMRAEGKLADSEMKFLLTGGVAVSGGTRNPYDAWLSDKSWGEICRMSDLERTKGFMEVFGAHEGVWRDMFESAEPYAFQFPDR
jgi:dynein heavy chain